MDIETILATIGGVMAALWAGWSKYFNSDKEGDEKKALPPSEEKLLTPSLGIRNDVIDALVAQADIYTALNEGLVKTGAQRILLIHANNCGDRILYSSTQLYATVFSEVYNNAPPIRRYYQRRPIIDPHYLSMLRDLSSNRKTVLITSKLDDHMEVKSTYVNANIEEAHIYLAHIETGKIWYISAAFEKPPKDKSVIDYALLNCANEISTILQRSIFNPDE